MSFGHGLQLQPIRFALYGQFPLRLSVFDERAPYESGFEWGSKIYGSCWPDVDTLLLHRHVQQGN